MHNDDRLHKKQKTVKKKLKNANKSPGIDNIHPKVLIETKFYYVKYSRKAYKKVRLPQK